jgi:hypothetical protein
MTTILVSGVIANKYLQGGAVWTRLSWILGLQNLGFDVHFVEQIAADTCVDKAGSVVEFRRSANLEYFASVVQKFGLAERATLLYEDGKQSHGRSLEEVADIADEAALLVNIAGHLKLPYILNKSRCKAYIDLDPGYIQSWHITGSGEQHLLEHDVHFTVGENVGSPFCTVPTANLHWHHVRQPVVLEHWPVSSCGSQDRFTTVANWRGPYAPVTIDGQHMGSKVHEFRKFIDLPGRVSQTFELALGIHSGEKNDLDLLASNGWHVVDPRTTVPDPDSFRRYVQSSGAEFSVAQAVYVQTNSGWFSDRSVRYLASGKPVLVQDTGFSRTLPVGEGLIAFRTLEEAVAGATRIARDYEAHSQAAREIAEGHFDSDKVLADFVDIVGLTP